MSIPPTGEQYEIISGGHRAVITEVGATLRSYSVGGVDVVRGFAEDAMVRGGQGQNLIPWPNRIRDGKYTFAGKSHQLALTEPARGNASHGLARYVPWVLTNRAADQVTNRVRVYPQSGWPGWLEASITQRVAPDGLTVTVEVTNIGDREVPFGYGAHPYLTVGESVVDEVNLTVPAGSLPRGRRAAAPRAGLSSGRHGLRPAFRSHVGAAQPGHGDDRPDPGRGRMLARRPEPGRPIVRALGRCHDEVGAGVHRRRPYRDLLHRRRADDLRPEAFNDGPDSRRPDRARPRCDLHWTRGVPKEAALSTSAAAINTYP